MAVGVRSATPRSPLPVRTTAASPALARGGVLRTNRGAAEAGRRGRLTLPGTCGAVKRTNTRGGARPSTPMPQGPGPRCPRPRGRGGEAGRLPGSAHSLACSRIDCASTTTCQARGSCWDSRASETPPRTNVPPEWDSRRPGGRSTDCPHCGCPSMLPHGRSERDPRPACPLGSAPQCCLCTGVTPPVGHPRRGPSQADPVAGS